MYWKLGCIVCRFIEIELRYGWKCEGNCLWGENFEFDIYRFLVLNWGFCGIFDWGRLRNRISEAILKFNLNLNPSWLGWEDFLIKFWEEFLVVIGDLAGFLVFNSFFLCKFFKNIWIWGSNIKVEECFHSNLSYKGLTWLLRSCSMLS